jgi:hypothetical protein
MIWARAGTVKKLQATLLAVCGLDHVSLKIFQRK